MDYDQEIERLYHAENFDLYCKYDGETLATSRCSVCRDPLCSSCGFTDTDGGPLCNACYDELNASAILMFEGAWKFNERLWR